MQKRPASRLSNRLVVAMVAAVAGVAALAFWDETRESAAALEDFGAEQATLASSVANELSTRLQDARRQAELIAEASARGAPVPASVLRGYLDAAVHPRDAAPPRAPPGTFLLDVPVGARRVALYAPTSELLAGISRLQHPWSLVVLVQPPGEKGLRTMDGRTLESPPVTDALLQGRSMVRLTGAEAAHVGLAERTAFAGLARVDAAPLGTWSVAVVTSAERERNRERRARVRLMLAVALAGGLVTVFGGLALGNQRKQLEVSQTLALTELARERDERLARLNRAATMVTLASGVAHEVATPLGVIAGRAEQLLPKVSFDERAQKSVQAILEQTERVEQIIRGFLDLARGAEPSLEEARPEAIVDGALALVEHRFERAGVALKSKIPTALPNFRGDARLLQHALVNLLLNACDATPRGGHVEVSIAADDASVSFLVQDDGEGIAEENAARVTEPFFTTKPRGKGTGLGLAIANEIAKSHRGALSIGPAAPHGTRACVQIPLNRGATDVRI